MAFFKKYQAQTMSKNTILKKLWDFCEIKFENNGNRIGFFTYSVADIPQRDYVNAKRNSTGSERYSGIVLFVFVMNKN